MFRRIFARRGLPDRVRVDNGYPWGTPRDSPPKYCAVADRPGGRADLEPAGAADVQPQGGAVQRPGPAMGRVAHLPRPPASGPAAGVGLPRPARGVPGDPRPAADPGVPGAVRIPALIDRRGSGGCGSWPGWTPSCAGCWLRRADCDGKVSIYGHGRSVDRCWARRDLIVRPSTRRRGAGWSPGPRRGARSARSPASELTRERIHRLAGRQPPHGKGPTDVMGRNLLVASRRANLTVA